jgi:hypothetical protein
MTIIPVWSRSVPGKPLETDGHREPIADLSCRSVAGEQISCLSGGEVRNHRAHHAVTIRKPVLLIKLEI